MNPIVTEEEYKGSQVIVLRRSEDDRYPFSFGLGKARLILAAIDEIKAFVEKHGGEENAKATET